MLVFEHERSTLHAFNLIAVPKKIWRAVSNIEIKWEIKEDVAKVKRELAASSVGRQARRDGTIEAIALVFPAAELIQYTKAWEKITCENYNWDLRKMADDFKTFHNPKGIKLDAKTSKIYLQAFVQSYLKRNLHSDVLF